MDIAIIDDETNARNTLVSILSNYLNIKFNIYEYNSIKTAYSGLKIHNFELVFLDINLSDGNGFELLDLINNRKFKVIFVTAFSEYAIKAFKYSAFEYVLKPVSIDEIKLVFDKLNEVQPLSLVQKNFYENTSKKNINSSILLNSQNGLEVINFDDIIKVDSSKSYSIFYLKNNDKKVSSKNLGYYEEILPENKFIRVHNSSIINIEHFVCYNQNGTIEMLNKIQITVSKRKKSKFFQFLNAFIKNKKY